MIWQFNPKTHRVYVPYAGVTVHGVKNVDAAHELINDEFNPSLYQYTVQSKTGKPYNFENFSDATNFALNKSTKTVCYTVYRNGKPEASFINKKQLPKWELVYEQKNENRYWTKSVTEFLEKTNSEKGHVAESYWDRLSVKIEKCGDKVRIAQTTMMYRRLKTNYVLPVFRTDIITCHKDGKVYFTANGKLKHISATRMYVYGNDELIAKLKEELTKLRPELKQVISVSSSWDMIAIFSRPTAFFKFDTFHKKAYIRGNERLYFGYYPREIVDESKLVDVLAKRMRIPETKSLRKVYFQNIYNMQVVNFLKHAGFKDTNSYQKLTGIGIALMNCNPANAKPFISALIKYRGENQAVKMISDTSRNLVRDTYNMYPSIDEEIAAYIIKNARNIEEIHDTFNRQQTSEVRVDKKISYSKKEKERFEYNVGDVIFRLAEGSKDLAIIGAKMGICVGGYANEALRKYTTIIKMMHGDKYIACIEYRGGEIEQIKAQFNNPVKSEYKKAIDSWLKHGDIECHCTDYKRIGMPWHSQYNYAHINPDDFEPRRPVLQIVKHNHEKFEYRTGWLTKNDYITNRIEDPYVHNMADSDFNPFEAHFEAVETDELPF